MMWLGWLCGMVLGAAVLVLIPGEQSFLGAFLLGVGCAGTGLLIGRAAER
jgi:hypothetical protein